MANSRTPAELKNGKLEHSPPLFRPLAQYLGSDKRRGLSPCVTYCMHLQGVPRQFVYGHFVYDTSSTDISSTTVYQRTGQLYIQLLFQQIIIFINSNFYLHYGSLLSI